MYEVLHWLTEFKIAVLAFDCVRGAGPAYFKDVCVPVLDIAARSSVRSAERGDLFVPRTRTTKLSRRSFTVAAPVVWNSLPAHLRSPLISRVSFGLGLKPTCSSKPTASENIRFKSVTNWTELKSVTTVGLRMWAIRLEGLLHDAERDLLAIARLLTKCYTMPKHFFDLDSNWRTTCCWWWRRWWLRSCSGGISHHHHYHHHHH